MFIHSLDYVYKVKENATAEFLFSEFINAISSDCSLIVFIYTVSALAVVLYHLSALGNINANK